MLIVSYLLLIGKIIVPSFPTVTRLSSNNSNMVFFIVLFLLFNNIKFILQRYKISYNLQTLLQLFMKRKARKVVTVTVTV